MMINEVEVQQIITPIDNIIDNISLLCANKSDIKSHCTPHQQPEWRINNETLINLGNNNNNHHHTLYNNNNHINQTLKSK